MRRSLIFAIALIAAPAAAQEIPADSPSSPAEQEVKVGPDGRPMGGAFTGDFLVVAAGVVSMPTYEGSNDRRIGPAGGIYANFRGVEINPRAAGLALDVIPDAKGSRIGINFGPLGRYRSNRTGKTDDPVVDLLAQRDGVFELGFAAGVSFKHLLNDFDRVTVGADFRWDVSGKSDSLVIAPGVSYFTPINRGQVIGARLGAEFVNDNYANYNYAISPAESATTGLPVYVARGGFKEWNLGAFTAVDLNGDFTDGGFILGAGAYYSRLQGSGAETPLTSIRGERGQWYFGAGLGYTF